MYKQFGTNMKKFEDWSKCVTDITDSYMMIKGSKHVFHTYKNTTDLIRAMADNYLLVTIPGGNADDLINFAQTFDTELTRWGKEYENIITLPERDPYPEEMEIFNHPNNANSIKNGKWPSVTVELNPYYFCGVLPVSINGNAYIKTGKILNLRINEIIRVE